MTATRHSDNPPVDSELWQAFRKREHELIIQNSRIGCVLIVVLMPLGSLLDFFVYPNLPGELFVSRVMCDLFVLPIYPLLGTSFGRRHAWQVSFAGALMPMLTMCWMIFATAGAMSPYYAGLNLVTVGICLFLPYDFLNSLAYCLCTFAAYAMACVLSPHQGFAHGTLFNNLYFMILTSILCVISCHYFTKRRFSDFRLRFELDQRNQELTQLDQLKSHFFANVSHELRTPLTLILAPVERLLSQSRQLPADTTRCLEMVMSNGLRLLRLINDLLDLIRLDERRLTLDRKLISLQEFLPGLVDSMRELATRRNIRIDVEPPAQPLSVQGDQIRLEKIFLNLLTNAMKFTPSGGKIRLRWWKTNRRIYVEVHDTGEGIPPADLPRIFDRFHQADQSSTRRYQGLGLGLSMAKELVQEHRGELTATSQLGKGSTFLVMLPESPAELTEDGQPMESSMPPGGPSPGPLDPAERRPEAVESALLKWSREADRMLADPHTPLDDAVQGKGTTRVLVVDDEPDMRRYLATLLDEEYTVLQAADGRGVQAICESWDVNVVVLDQMMPHVTGMDVCRQLRSQPALVDLKILMLTARADEATKLEALEAGVDDFLMKPFRGAELRMRIHSLVRTCELQKDLRQRNHQLQEALTQLKATESQLVQSEKINSLGILAAGLLHEINNPLNYMMMAGETLARQFDHLPSDACEIVEDIRDGLERIARIISDLRTFAYPEQAHLKECFEIRHVVDSSLRFTAHELRNCTVDVSRVNGELVVGSPSHITHVLVNMLLNAAKAVESTGALRPPKIEIAVKSNKDRIVVQVRDNGAGISPDFLPRIFDPFVTTRAVGQGMGLGLSICHTIVKNHGGSIHVSSTPGSGSEFTFDLPMGAAGTQT